MFKSLYNYKYFFVIICSVMLALLGLAPAALGKARARTHRRFQTSIRVARPSLLDHPSSLIFSLKALAAWCLTMRSLPLLPGPT